MQRTCHSSESKCLSPWLGSRSVNLSRWSFW